MLTPARTILPPNCQRKQTIIAEGRKSLGNIGINIGFSVMCLLRLNVLDYMLAMSLSMFYISVAIRHHTSVFSV